MYQPQMNGQFYPPQPGPANGYYGYPPGQYGGYVAPPPYQPQVSNVSRCHVVLGIIRHVANFSSLWLIMVTIKGGNGHSAE